MTKRRKPRTIFDLKKMDKKRWTKYAQTVETEFNKFKISEEITRIKEEGNSNNKDSLLQEIWNKIEELIKSAGKKCIPTKKINRTSKPILKNNGHTPSFKDLREATSILSLIKKFQENKNSDLSSHNQRKN